MNDTYSNDNEDLRACFAGGSLADPFLPTQLRAAAEHYAAGTGEDPSSVLARLQDSQWELQGFADPYPDLPAPVLTVTPWSEDLDLWETVAELEAAYPGANRDALAGMLRDLRWELRKAVTAEAAPRIGDQVAVRNVLDNGVGELVTYATTDAEITTYVTAAEAGSGGPLPGLREELTRLRDEEASEHRRLVDVAKAKLGETERRVFVGGAFGDPVSVQVSASVNSAAVPRIANVGETEDFAEPGESGCRFAYRG
ncbi:Uncharacterised protein [Mycobacteroides abscessus subsp. abscessus]|uniref:hypothetical protein n=1 Tax=Mycobacteroides abscessus TaxID=36809 RepID=UPI0009A90FE2|nr:hypothetical protein [Mycobacteroides abscessus]SKR41669.1 Uncharacterised protein [Mycobacteroides abscessus subsp. abscessus]